MARTKTRFVELDAKMKDDAGDADHLSAVERMAGNIDQYRSAPPTEIRFRPGQSVLSKQAKDALDELAARLKNQHGYVIDVQGFSLGQGRAAIAHSRTIALPTSARRSSICRTGGLCALFGRRWSG